ncbi:MAG TPA: Txe/YoeB family addiction module toxin [Porphyromonadaceae bacterium]|jgi:toxin YoeB|uniref:Txe/YoeB family addiction module toxin n=1 Tax=Limibacterium fermenti TaxID=3229863 RepID=UPI000E7EACD1|nr:Txe/YoeB family addiction module toxin [Porphyromonadaceae bacterium]HBK33223.1 Txe/YoeB family addiction module toxin [Porphyromonadaceae bacterium]HBL32493.1 Txe/YoeB family addiction module toxin [Porphyromonadaceae bacterium]HBX46010.1 Txe/YoeB family addiction module toxin [Porphyromonadaceae bacterium]HCM19536.1 Txe/YoeB family addiction module toxin [Porphyromonadaceae bacterium]
MEIIYLPQADEDLAYWIKNGNKAILKKIAELTKAILENPFEGIGKPEALKYSLAPKWSRRITSEHRYIYLVRDGKLFVYSLRGHYENF